MARYITFALIKNIFVAPHHSTDKLALRAPSWRRDPDAFIKSKILGLDHKILFTNPVYNFGTALFQQSLF